ncbi:MAG: zinc dependent phospholipase C family protein [Chloroflexota bacterium]
MPPLCLHLGIAKEAASQLRHSAIRANLGAYLLGATSPDVRILTGAARYDTHFYPLDGEAIDSSVCCFLRTHPELAIAGELDDFTAAFVAGYLSHLVTDEAWIVDIYRPYFNKAVLPVEGLVNMLDRALQYELDRRERTDHESMLWCQTQLDRLEIDRAVGFFDADTLQRWRRFVWVAAGREPTWGRFRSFAERFLLSSRKVEEKCLELFLASLPQMLQQTVERVTEERLRVFRQEVVGESVHMAEEYLN